MALDVTGIIILILFFIRGYMRGFILAAFSVLAILLGALCALKLSQTFAAWLLAKGYITSGWAQIVSYAILFIGVVLVVRLIANMIQRAIETMALGVANRLLGGLLYGALGVVLWSSALWIGNRMGAITPELIAASKTYTTVSGIAPWVWEQAGKEIPFVKDTFSGLSHFFDTVNQNAQDHVGAH